MQLAMIGIGRMGANMVRRLVRAGHSCVVFDRSQEAVSALAAEGAEGSASMDELVRKLARPRVIWMMVPAAVVDRTVLDVASLLDQGVVVCINTDDPPMFDTDLGREYRSIAAAFDLDVDDLARLVAHGVRASFLSDTTKTPLLQEIDHHHRSAHTA